MSNRLETPVRLLLIGETGVGKTALIIRWDAGTFTHMFTATIGVDYRSKRILVDQGAPNGGLPLSVQVWDTAGQERYHAITAGFFNRADGVVIAFDCSSRESFERAPKWMSELRAKKTLGVDVNAILVATKCDVEERAVSELEGRKLGDEFGVPYFETSAKLGLGVNEVFEELAGAAARRKLNSSGGSMATAAAQQPSALPPTSPPQPPLQGCC